MNTSCTDPSSSSDRDLRVSVVVAARNAGSTLEAFFDAMRRQTLRSELWELIIVDDGSADATPTIASNFSHAQLIRADRHVGLPAARNLGIVKARAPIVALTDADCVPDPEWLENGVTEFARTEHDLIAGAVTIPIGKAPTIAAVLDASRFLNQEQYVSDGFGAGANLWIKREVFSRVGLFNERLAAYGGDDEEFGQRATSHGASLGYASNIHIRHPPRSRARQVARKAYRLGFGSAAQRRHAEGPLAAAPPAYRRRGGWIPMRTIRGLDRVRKHGFRPTKMQLFQLYVAQYLLIQLPRTVGDVIGEVLQRLPRKVQRDSP